jgi:hypothetical protein
MVGGRVWGTVGRRGGRRHSLCESSPAVNKRRASPPPLLLFSLPLTLLYSPSPAHYSLRTFLGEAGSRVAREAHRAGNARELEAHECHAGVGKLPGRQQVRPSRAQLRRGDGGGEGAQRASAAGRRAIVPRGEAQRAAQRLCCCHRRRGRPGRRCGALAQGALRCRGQRGAGLGERTRRVQLVRRDGRDVSTLYGRGGRGGAGRGERPHRRRRRRLGPGDLL